MLERAPHIELQVEGTSDGAELVPLLTFVRATETLTELLVQIAADRPRRANVDWFVSGHREGGTVFAVEGRGALTEDWSAAREIMQTAVDAFEALGSNREMRGILSFQALEKARSLASLRNDGAGSIVLRGFGREVSITAAAAERAEASLNRRYYSFGSIEGTVETISIHEARPYFIVFHALDSYAIKCRCNQDLLAQVKAAMGSRVLVSGTIGRRFDGRSESVDAAHFRILRGRDQLSQVSEVRGLLSGSATEASEARQFGSDD